MQYYDITLTGTGPGAVRQVDADGDYLYYYNGSAGGADTTIKVKERTTGLEVLLLPGQAFRMQPGKSGSSWVLTNKAGQGTILGLVVIGRGELTDNRITGSVEVIDGEKARTMAGGMFAGAVSLAGTAAQWGWVQLWNPAGSGKNLMVNNADASGNGTAVVNVVYMLQNVQRASASGGTVNKKAGGAASAAQTRSETNATPDSLASGVMRSVPIPVGGYVPWKVGGAIVVPPGWGLSLYNNGGTGTGFGANFEWFEESQ